MYLHSLKLKNIRSIREFELELSEEEYAGWHVILGDNGAGKSTFARAVALALIGPEEMKLPIDWREWLRADESTGNVEVYLQRNEAFDEIGGGGRSLGKDYLIPAGVSLNRNEESGASRVDLAAEEFEHKGRPFDLTRYVWSDKPGWFSASYGPFRRFSGGDMSYDKLFHIYRRLSRHLSVFGEDVALTEAIEWLRELDVERLRHPQRHSLLSDVQTFVNQSGFLPHETKLEKVDEHGVLFVDGNGCTVPVTQLSDGFRSVLSMTFELLRQLVQCYGATAVFKHVRAGKSFIDLPGVIIIDEVDAHLHPPWQRRIGQWFTRVFPRLQFFVTTHSPLVCQAAEHGSVWRLPTPGTNEKGRRVTGVELQRLVRGNLLEAMDTELFGEDVGRSETGRKDAEELAKLNRLAMRGELTEAQGGRRAALQAQLPTRADSTKGSDGGKT